MRRLLFVDDEVPILRALERMLRAYRKDWECHVSDDPVAALDLVDELAPDAVISDMLMPGMDGAEFLTEAARRRPLMARFILSGEVGAGSLVRMARAAHQCFAKPCRGDVLMDVLQRSLVNPLLVRVPAVMAGLYGMHRLPVSGPEFERLRRLLAQPGGDDRDREALALIEGSVGIATKLLQVATWTRLGVGAPPAHVHDAYYQLGPESVWSLVDADLLGPLPGSGTTPFQHLVWQRCSQVAAVASAMARGDGLAPDTAREVSLVALWSTAGPLLLDSTCRDDYAAVRQSAVETGQPLADAERAYFGRTAAQIFAKLLRLWGLSPSLAAMASHGDDLTALTTEAMAPDVYAYAARLVVDELDGRACPPEAAAFFARHGLGARLDPWRAAAAHALASIAA